MERSIRVREEVLERSPEWATSLGQPLPNTRQWTARVGGELVGGAVLWTTSRHGTLLLEALADGAPVGLALLREVLARVDGPVELTVDAGAPMVPEVELRRAGLAVRERVVEVERALGTVRPAADGLQARPLDARPPGEQQALVGRILGSQEAGRALLEELKDRFVERDAWAVLRRGSAEVGVVLPVWEPPQPGSIAWMGVLPDARGQGLGRALHRWGLCALQRLGATLYLDHTEVENAPMRAVFARNGCAEKRVLWTWSRA